MSRVQSTPVSISTWPAPDRLRILGHERPLLRAGAAAAAARTPSASAPTARSDPSSYRHHGHTPLTPPTPSLRPLQIVETPARRSRRARSSTRRRPPVASDEAAEHETHRRGPDAERQHARAGDVGQRRRPATPATTADQRLQPAAEEQLLADAGGDRHGDDLPARQDRRRSAPALRPRPPASRATDPVGACEQAEVGGGEHRGHDRADQHVRALAAPTRMRTPAHRRAEHRGRRQAGLRRQHHRR